MSGREPIVVERVIRARPERVFAAFSDPESLATWMCPAEDITHASVEVDFRVGGRFRIVMHGERDYVQHGAYLAIEPPRRLQMTWISDWMPEAERETRVTVTFEPAGDGTRVRLVHDELPAGDAYEGHVAGWARILARLSDSLEP